VSEGQLEGRRQCGEERRLAVIHEMRDVSAGSMPAVEHTKIARARAFFMVPRNYARAPSVSTTERRKKLKIALSRRPVEGFGNSHGAPYDGAVLDRDGSAGEYRSKTRRAEQDAARDHPPPRFRHRRHAKLHSARDRAPVPGRLQTAPVLFPYAHPRKIGWSPYVTEHHAQPGRK